MSVWIDDEGMTEQVKQAGSVVRVVRGQAGPRGTYGCACKSHDAAECHRMRYGIVAGDVSHGAEECYCLCHQWSDDDDDLG